MKDWTARVLAAVALLIAFVALFRNGVAETRADRAAASAELTAAVGRNHANWIRYLEDVCEEK